MPYPQLSCLPIKGSTYSLSAITLALAELPRTLVAAGLISPLDCSRPQSTPDHSAFLAHAKEAMRQMALHVGDFSQLCHALAGVLRQHTSVVLMPVVSPETEAILLFVLELCFSAVQAISEFKDQVARVTQIG